MMLKPLISKLLHRYIGMSEPIAPSTSDNQTDIVSPSNRNPEWRNSFTSGAATLQKPTDHPNSPTQQKPLGNIRKENRKKGPKIFDSSFS